MFENLKTRRGSYPRTLEHRLRKARWASSRRAENAPNWKGGQTENDGYIFIMMPEHPRADPYGYVKRARLVLEQKLGRPLLPRMEIHHINGIRNDDRPENLEELTHADHRHAYTKSNLA